VKILKGIAKVIIGILKGIIQVIDTIYSATSRKWLNPHYREWQKRREEEAIEYEGLPYRCRSCELLGECRRPKEQGWKCYHGCIILNEERARQERK